MEKCSYDPTDLANAPIGMFHCPECGEMVLAGLPHPDYSLEDPEEGEEEDKFGGGWNYRIARREYPKEIGYFLVEAYYRRYGDDEIDAITVNAMEPYGETLDELRSDMALMMQAFSRPVIDYETRENVPEEVISRDKFNYRLTWTSGWKSVAAKLIYWLERQLD